MVALSMTYASPASAGEMLKQGDPIGPFTVTKLAGAPEDGVEVGQSLCYRCRYGSRPMVLIFAHEPTESLVKLVRELDTLVSKHHESELKALVTLLGGDRETLQRRADALAKDAGATHVPFAIPNDGENGPEQYGLDQSSDVVVVIANDSPTVASYAFTPDHIDEVDSVLNR